MGRWKAVLTLTLTTFVVSIVFNLGSNSVLAIMPVTASLVLLLFIILIGVVFDILGVAATAGEEAPFHAMASNRVRGARHAILLVRHADGVSTFCNDLVGDVVGTLSGALGVAILLQLRGASPRLQETVANTLMVALIAAVTVGGKALGKGVAISKSTTILLVAGRILYSLEKIGVRLPGLTVKSKKR
jgi:Mg2+/Co2+ transporter CorB